MSFQDHPYADFLHQVSKPARYVGGEHFSVAKMCEKTASLYVALAGEAG